MNKITHHNYEIPVIYPAEIVAELTSGANCPVHIRGFDKAAGKKKEYVVKLRDSERMGDPAAAMREFLACFIAAEMEIAVAEPVMVDVTPDMAELTESPILKQRILNSAGFNFGTEHLGLGFQVIPLRSPFPQKLMTQAQDIVVLDLLLQNPDRTSEKPNMLTNGSVLVAIDHELAFSFVFLLLMSSNLWQQSIESKRWIDELVLLQHIRGQKYDFEQLSTRLNRLNGRFWDKAEKLLPPNCRHNSFETIKKCLLYFVEQQEKFINELKNIMA
jgi:hypothetical protein